MIWVPSLPLNDEFAVPMIFDMEIPPNLEFFGGGGPGGPAPLSMFSLQEFVSYVSAGAASLIAVPVLTNGIRKF